MSIKRKEIVTVASPCVRNCCLNTDDICVGCYRHIDEILAWQSYKNNEKQKVITCCKQRRIADQKILSQGKG